MAQEPETVTGTTLNTTHLDVKALAADHLPSARRRAGRCRCGEDDHGDEEAMVAVMTVLAIRAIPPSPKVLFFFGRMD